MFNFITNIFGNIFTRHSSSFLSSLMIFDFILKKAINGLAKFSNWLKGITWLVVRFVLGVIEAFEYIINSMLGLKTVDGKMEAMTLEDIFSYSDMNIAGSKEVKADGTLVDVSFIQGLVKVFKAMVAVAIVFLIVFTIIAIIRQEYANAQEGFEKKSKDGKVSVGNDKTGIMAKLFKNLIYIVVLPISMIFIITGVNSILAAFANAIGAAKGTVAGQILAASTYDANRYRKYANADQRTPIIISAYDSSDYKTENIEKFALQIRSASVQDKLKSTADDIVNGGFLSFNKSLSYHNNKISNSADYGDYYEQFVCTAEQYQVMADFIDTAELLNLSFTIKSMDDPNINWKYVNDAVYSKTNNTLTINYRDASDLNNNGKDDDSYTIVYSPSNQITSPIQDALNSIMAMLGAGEYSDNVYNTMERDDSGNFVNLVQWANEKALIKLSNVYDPALHYENWTKEDQVIIYELNHFSSNNTFGDATVDDLKKGIELDVKQIVYRTYYPEADAYSSEKTIDCVYINGSYYPVKISLDYADNFGNPYYELDVPDDVNFLAEEYSILKKSETSATLKLSNGFDINNYASWTTSDQIIVYEYYKDLSYNNSLSKYKFSDFESGVTLESSSYTITVQKDLDSNVQSTLPSKNYVLLNGTYYELYGDKLSSSTTTPGSFMQTLDSYASIHYDFKLNVDTSDPTNSNASYYQFVGADNIVEKIGSYGSVEGTEIYETDVSLKLSNNFNFKDISTWSYRDYFIFYLYIRYGVAHSLDDIKLRGVVGKINKKIGASEYYFIPEKYNTAEFANGIYISMDDINSISELNIQKSLNIDKILEENDIDTVEDKLFVNFDEFSSIYLKDAESRHFELSETFDYYDVSTWTVLDLILNYLSSKEVIADFDTIKTIGYYAVKFETDNGIIYRFGPNGGTGTVYLSETNVNNLKDSSGRKMFPSFEAFLRSSAYRFITQLLNVSENDLISSKTDLVNNIFNTYSVDILDTSKLISNLIDENFGEFNSVMTEYTYMNSSFNKDDLTTWTNMDIALYCITGSATGKYKSYVVTDSTNNYFIINDKALNISADSDFECVVSAKNADGDEATLEISSSTLATYDSTNTTTTTITTADELSEFVNGLTFVKNEAPENLTLDSSLRYVYKIKQTIDKNNLPADLSTATILDIILAEIMGNVTENQDYYFNIYKSGEFDYIKINGHYIEIYDNSRLDSQYKYIKFKPVTMFLSAMKKDFIDMDSDNIRDYNYQVGSGFNISYLDTIIYSITNSIAEKTYKIIKIKDIPYINVNGILIQTLYGTSDFTVNIKIGTTDEDDMGNLSYSIPGADESDQVSSCDQLGYLYDNYYSKYLSSPISSYDDKNIYPKAKYDSNFDISDVTTWTPLNLILNHLGVTNFQNGTVYKNETGYYLKFSNIIDGTQKTFYIDITDIINVGDLKTEEDLAANSNVLEDNSDAIQALRLMTYFITDIYGISGLKLNDRDIKVQKKSVFSYEDNGTKLSHDEILSLYQSLYGRFDSFGDDVNVVEDIKQTFETEIDFDDPTTWNWFKLINYNFKKSEEKETIKYLTYVSNNETYIELESEVYGKIYVIASSASASSLNLFSSFTVNGNSTVKYSEEDNIENTLLELIYYKLTNQTNETTINKYTYESLGTSKSFYIINEYRTGNSLAIFETPTLNNSIQSSLNNTNSVIYVEEKSENVKDWNVFDFILFHARAHTSDFVLVSNIYEYNNQIYLLIGNECINIKVLGYNNADIAENSARDFISISGTVVSSKYNLGQILGITGEVYDSTQTMFVSSTDKIAIKYDLLEIASQEVITNFYDGNYTISDINDPANINKIDTLKTNNNAKLVQFSQNFNPSDYKTWTLSDILIYYAVLNDFYQATDGRTDGDGKLIYLPSEGDIRTYVAKRFQSYIENRCVPAYVYNILNEDEKGNVSIYKVISLSNQATNPGGIYFNYDVFENLKTRKPINLSTIDTGFLSLDIFGPDTPNANIPSNNTTKNFTYASKDVSNIVDFVYKNYYFFNLDSTKFGDYGLNGNIDKSLENSIAAGTATISGTINLSLMKDNARIDINDVSTWNLLHLIAIYEYSRQIENNVFNNVVFEDMYSDNYFLLYASSSDKKEKILFINGNYYDLTNYVTKLVKDSTDDEYILKRSLEDNGGTNSILNLAQNRINLIEEVIQSTIETVRNWYVDRKYIDLAIESTGDNRICNILECIVHFHNDRKYLFTPTEISPIVEYGLYLEGVKDNPSNEELEETNKILNFIASLDQRVNDYAQNKFRNYIKETINNTTSRYKYAEIRDDETINKLFDIIFNIGNYDLVTEVNQIKTQADQINDAKIKSIADYETFVRGIREKLVEEESLGWYSADELKAIFKSALERAFAQADGETEIPNNIGDYTLVDSGNDTGEHDTIVDINAVINILKNDPTLTAYEKALLVGQAEIEDIDNSNISSLLLYDKSGDGNINDLRSITGFLKVNSDYPNDNILSNIITNLNSGFNYNDIIKVQNELITRNRPIDQKSALLRRKFLSKPSTTNAISEGTVNNYTFRTNVENVSFIKRPYTGAKVLGSGADYCSYEAIIGGKNVRIYRAVDYRVKDVVKVNLSDTVQFGTYKISPLVKTVSWPQKLMEDMKVLYPDLNWGTLIATDGWLDTLGEFTSAYANGQFISKGNSANTTAAGLVLSEFFLSKATVPVDGYANFEYETLFDENVIKSLMLSLMGEEAYNNLSMQAEIFMEMFNSTFAQILDDIARENAIEVVDGQVSNFTMCVYKSYLATVLLSSDIGEYLYTIATRIFAQYTIYESLACSTGDYAGYYAYTSEQLDENGNVVDKFMYGSFYDLVRYENMYAGNSSPVYTFNMKKAFMRYAKHDNDLKNKTDSQLNDEYKTILQYENEFKKWYDILFEYVDNIYRNEYSVGAKIEDTSDIYCFMFEVYWEIKNDNKKNEPTYLKLYRKYLTGEIERWSSIKDVSISGTDKYISKYDKYEKALKSSKIPVLISFGQIISEINSKSENVNELQNKVDKGSMTLKDVVDKITGKIEDKLEIDSTVNILKRSLSYEYSKKLKWFNASDFLKIYNLLASSEDGGKSSNESWLKINQMYEDVAFLLAEVGEIKELVVGDSNSSNRTQNGSIRMYEDDEIYDTMIEQLSALHQAFGNYISAQNMLDKIIKASITYTLGQYGQNYVTTGYKFNIENRDYTFNANISALRLAEYVYGGKFLIDVNSYPVYTNEEYEGLVRQSKKYDEKDGQVKTYLEMWPELRQFASNLANYTAKIYYQTNLKDLSPNIIDNVKLTDYVKDGSGKIVTLEYVILKYLLSANSNCELDNETLIRIMFADNSDTISSVVGTSSEYVSIVNYLEGVGVVPSNTKTLLSKYVDLVYGPNYNAAGKYNSGSDSPAQRIHKMFKNVMSYLLVSEDKESDKEKPFVLDDITFKQFKMIVMERIATYKENLSETAEQNANRYLTLFDLLSGQMNYFYKSKDRVDTSSRVLTNYLVKSSNNSDGLKIKYSDANISDVTVIYSSDRSTRNVILNLAGVANRPLSELVNLEYDKMYDRNGNYDEALGDVFVLCFYDERDGMYYPYLAKGYNVSLQTGTPYHDFFRTYPQYGIETKYYNSAGRGTSSGVAYPIIAKGIITAGLKPTAIKMVEDKVVFYRTQILATTTVNESAINATQAVSEVKNVGHVETAESTSYKHMKGWFSLNPKKGAEVAKARNAMFISSMSLNSFVNSDVDAYFMQNQVEYISYPDEYGMFFVLEEFDKYYSLEGMSITLLCAAFIIIIPIMFKASASVLRRIIDLIFYILIGPVVISMTSLDYEDKGAGKVAFDKWKQGITQALLAAFGYIIGFRIYYLLTQTTLKMTFISDETFASIKRIGGLGFLTQSTVDNVLRFMFIFTCTSMIEKSGSMILRMISGGQVEDPFASPIGGKDVLATLQDMKSEMQKSIERLGGIYTGKAFVDAKNAALEATKAMIPGSALIGSAVDTAKGISTHVQSKKLEKSLKEKGIAKDVAKQSAKSFKENKQKQQDQKTQNRLKSANNFMQTYMGDKKDHFKKSANPIEEFKKGFKELGKTGKKDKKPKKPKKDKPQKPKKK